MKKTYLLALALAAISVNALADDSTYVSGPYVGLQAGYAYMDYKNTDYVVSSDSKAYDNKFAGRVYGGYAFTEHLATELGYTYFNNPEFRDNASGSQIDIKQSSLDLNAKAILSFANNFGGYFRLGAAWVHRGSTDGSSLFVQKGSSNKITPLAGIAATYDFTPHVTTDLSWTYMFSNGDLPKLNIFALGIAYKF